MSDGLPTRTPDFGAYQDLEASFEPDDLEASFEPDKETPPEPTRSGKEVSLQGWGELKADWGRGILHGRWFGLIPAIVMLAAIGTLALSFQPWAEYTVSILIAGSIVAVLYGQSMTKESKRIRLNLAVSPQVKERIDRLQDLSDAANVTEVIRRSLAHYEELLKLAQEGRKIIIEDEKGERERLRIV